MTEEQTTSQERHELVSRLLEGAERDKAEITAYPSGTETQIKKDGPAMCTLVRKASKLSRHPDFTHTIQVRKEKTDGGPPSFSIQIRDEEAEPAGGEGTAWETYTSDDICHAIVFSRIAGLVEGMIDELERDVEDLVKRSI